ncbi:MAG: hypothetical protein H7338_07635 [Candidatus Sericytochromatia bacterium]|nr:hypothetical protein [Candidatus Sericytochromatia bacterium]
MSRFAALALVCTLGTALPAFAAVDPTVQLWEAQPGNDGLAVAAARQAMGAGKLTAAAKFLTTCIATHGEHQMAKAELGWLRFLEDKPDEAVPLLIASEKAPVYALGQSRLAWVYTAQGKRGEAIKSALSARKIKEGQPLALLTLGVVAEDAGRARQYLTEAAAASPSPWPHFYLGKRSSGEAALRAFGESYTRSLATQDLFESGARTKALGAVTDLVQGSMALRPVWVDQLETLAGQYPRDLTLSDMLVSGYAAAGKQEYAIAELRRRLGFAENKPEILRLIARMYVDLVQDELALETYDRALRILATDQRSPLAHDIRCDRVALLIGVKRESEAAVELDRILKEEPKARRAKLLKGLLLGLQQEWPKAAETIAGIDPVNAEERLLVSMISYRQSKPARWAQIFGGNL